MTRHASSLSSSSPPMHAQGRPRERYRRYGWWLAGLAALALVAVLLVQFGVMRGLSLQILAWQRELHGRSPWR